MRQVSLARSLTPALSLGESSAALGQGRACSMTRQAVELAPSPRGRAGVRGKSPPKTRPFQACKKPGCAPAQRVYLDTAPDQAGKVERRTPIRRVGKANSRPAGSETGAPGAVSRCAAAAREGGCARGCKSHRSNWTVRDRTARCLSARKARRGVSSPGTEPMGLNEDEPQLMSLVMTKFRSRRIPGAWVKADVCAWNNRQCAQSPAGSAWQARREGRPQIKRGERSR
jgi:hypothetical protein